jgi:hypothetical protein
MHAARLLRLIEVHTNHVQFPSLVDELSQRLYHSLACLVVVDSQAVGLLQAAAARAVAATVAACARVHAVH